SNFLSGGSANPTSTDTGGGSAPSATTTPLGATLGTTSATPSAVGVNTPATSGGTVTTFPGGGGSAHREPAAGSEVGAERRIAEAQCRRHDPEARATHARIIPRPDLRSG